MDPSKVAVIIPAAGSGIRMGLSSPKQFYELEGIPILVHTLMVFQQVESVGRIIVVVPAESCGVVQNLVDQYQLDKVTRVVEGGKERQDSVSAGLENLGDEIELVLVHDGVRPFVSAAVIEECLKEAEKSGAAMAAIPVKDTLKAVSSRNVIEKTINRDGVWQAQTPQAAKTALLKEAYRLAAAKKILLPPTKQGSLNFLVIR